VRAVERCCLAVALLLLVTLPFCGRYTSIGLDFEADVDDERHAVYWRVRWPSDGALVFARIVERGPPGERAADAVDIGAALLREPQATGAGDCWQRHGFWWLSVDAREAAPPAIVAGCERAFVAGLPHWLWLLLFAAAGALLRRQRRRTSAGRKPIVGDDVLIGAAARSDARRSCVGDS